MFEFTLVLAVLSGLMLLLSHWLHRKTTSLLSEVDKLHAETREMLDRSEQLLGISKDTE